MVSFDDRLFFFSKHFVLGPYGPYFLCRGFKPSHLETFDILYRGKAFGCWGVAAGVFAVYFVEGFPITWPYFAKLPILGAKYQRQLEIYERAD